MKLNFNRGICLAIFCSFLLVSCNRTEEQKNNETPLRLVRTIQIEKPVNAVWHEFPGVVDAAQKAELGFRISGKLSKLLAKEGDTITKGQELAVLDATDSKISLASRQAEYDTALADFKRAQALVSEGVISRSDFDKLQAQEATTKANLAVAKQNLGYTSLRAPFSGRIAKRYLDNFEEVSAMEPIYSLQDISSMTVKVDIPESLVIRVRESAQPKISALFDAIPGEQFPLTIKEVSTQANAETNTFEVTLSMPTIKGYNILPGMSVTVRGEPDPGRGQQGAAFIVPAHAVLEDADGRFVYVTKPGDDSTAVVEKRAVTIGKLTSQGLELVAGVEIGEQLVTAGMSKMYPGLKVRLDTE